MSYSGSGELTSTHPSWEPAGRQEPARASAGRPQSTASLAAAVAQLLDGVTATRVPRVAGLRQRVQKMEAAWPLGELDQALRVAHRAAGAIDFLVGRDGSHAEQFRQQGG